MMRRRVVELIAAMGRTRPGRLILWKMLPACGVERMALRTDDGMFMVSTRDNMIALSLFLEGNFAKHLVEESCSLAAAYLGRNDLTYVDVGANIGSNTVYAMRNSAFASAVCFEPDALNFSNLVQTIDLNGLADRVRCVRKALGDGEGQASLKLSTANFGDHRIVSKTKSSAGVQNITVTSLDRGLTEAEAERVGLVCVDVQGYEGQVLSGASTLLERDIPFLCELTPNELKQCDGYDRFFEITERAFNWFVDMKEPTRLRPISELQTFADDLAGGYADVFLTKRSGDGLRF